MHYYLPGITVEKKDDNDIFGNGILKNKSTYFGKDISYNKLLQIDPFFPINYTPIVGDLIIGKIVKIESNRWVVELTNWIGYLQIFNVHYEKLSDFKMRKFLKINDWICAEVLKITSSSLELHMRRNWLCKLTEDNIFKVPLFLMRDCKNMYSENEIYFGANGIIYANKNIKNFIAEKIKNMKKIKFEEIKLF